MDIEIRQASLLDLPKIKDLFVNTVQECCSDDYDERQIEVWCDAVNHEERWEDAIKKQYFLLACRGEELLGFTSLEKTNLKIKGYLDFMFVHAAHQRKGIAKRLLNEVKLKAKSLGFKLIETDVSITAFEFFERNGFFKLRKNLNTKDNGVDLINYRMTKIL
ncbi:GNAT family N-acetyltransferase [uncultured Arcticibacterium sp.]|uniref:GNAT family N-acetyltransferase n=1 Tax=uncultured Arcticibacterium sp. TaxID=2173042 RepID=UPI0030F6FFBB